MDAKFLNKYIYKPLPWLISKAQETVNKYVRLRDRNQPCISCGQYKELEAGHYYSAGHNGCIRFNEKNIHGQCKRCNRHLHGNQIEYRKGLIIRYGNDYVLELDQIVSYYTKHGYKHDRIAIIETIWTYRKKIKELEKNLDI